MTADENMAIEKLRDELHEYHVDVQKLITRCEVCHEEVAQLQVEIYGFPGNKEASPGLLGEVAEMRGSRKRMLLAMRCAWGLLVAVAGALAAAFLKAKE
jgi:hypothetical protein